MSGTFPTFLRGTFRKPEVPWGRTSSTASVTFTRYPTQFHTVTVAMSEVTWGSLKRVL